MSRLCERPGCSQPAEVVYHIEPEQLSVWLGRIDVVEGGEQPSVLCRRHADAMVVPLGWSLDDQREAVPRLFRPAEPVAVVASGRVPARQPPSRAVPSLGDPVQLELGDESPVVPADSPAATVHPGWVPVFDHADDLGGLLHAESPLLARAFGGEPRRPKRD